VCQQLAGIALACRALEDELTAKARPLSKRAGDIREYVVKALAETRSLAQGLSPVELRQNDLPIALRQLASTVAQMYDVKCVVSAADDTAITTPEQSRQLYRIAQEATGNAVRHGRAKNIRLSLNRATGRLTLTVRDDGTGFAEGAELANGSGMGLPIMRYRAEQMGATLTVKRAGQRRGTVVTCSLPLPVRARRPKRRKKAR
jgi:signal transduction histidine kinase